MGKGKKCDLERGKKQNEKKRIGKGSSSKSLGDGSKEIFDVVEEGVVAWGYSICSCM